MTTTSGPFPPLNGEAALNWLRNAGQVQTTITALANEWRWDRSRASRALGRWESAGLITRRSGSVGKIIFSTAPAVHTAATAGNMIAEQSAKPIVSKGSAVLAVQASSTTVHVASQPKAGRDWSLTAHFALMLVAALGLGIVGGVMNARFAASFGRTDEAALLLGTIGALIDLLVVTLPTVGCCIWRAGRRLTGAAAWCLWLFVAGMSLLAGAGFGATNIGDAIADRDRVVHEVLGVRTTVDRLRAERTASTETRSTAVLQAQLERERALIDRGVWKATVGCHDVTVSESAAACSAIMATRQAMAAAARRDAIEAELHVAEEKLARLPAVQAAADPQAEMAAKIVDAVSFGQLKPDSQQIARLRIVGFALMPTLGGVVMMLGMALRREVVVS